MRTLLFLRNISQIEWQIDTEESGLYIRVTEHIDAARIVTVVGQADDESDVEEKWLVFEKEIKNPDGAVVKPVEVAFLVATESKEDHSIRCS